MDATNSQYQYTLEGENMTESEGMGARLWPAATIARIADVATDQQDRGLQATLVMDRDTASRLGIPQQAIDNTLYDAFGQRQVSTIYTQLNQYHVVMEVDPLFRESTDAIRQLYVDRRTEPKCQ